MIKFVGRTPGGERVIGFGLDYTNLEKLKAGQPIHVDLGPLGSTGQLVIFAGETLAKMTEDLLDAGVIGPDTKIQGLAGTCAR